MSLSFRLREGMSGVYQVKHDKLLRSEMLVAISSAAQERGRVRCVRKVREILHSQ